MVLNSSKIKYSNEAISAVKNESSNEAKNAVKTELFK